LNQLKSEMATKLLQINTVIGYNASGRIAEDIGQMVIDNGWESVIAFGRNACFSNSKLYRIGTDIDFKWHGLYNRLFDRQGFGSKKSTKKLIKFIEALKPDIIHLHNIHGYYINIEILFNYLALSNIPVVWTFHDCWPLTGHCAYFDFVDCNRWIEGCYACPQKNQYPASLWKDNSKRNYQDKKFLFNSVKSVTIVPVSLWLSKLVEKSFLKNHSQQLIYNGVNIKVFYPHTNTRFIKDKIRVGDRLMLFGVASKWEPRKGLNDFIKLSNMIDDNAVIVLIGLSEDQINNLPPNVIGICRTENVVQLAELYSAADLFLNLTYEDNFPTTNLESLACGTPVLTYKTGGSVEAVSSDTGFIVEKGDLYAVLDIISLINKKGKSEYIKACRDRAENLYNKNDRYNEYFELYEKLILQKVLLNK
jgi:putative colanic acid biosynthesis glycosyltransferase